MIELTRVLNNTPDANYVAEVNRVVDVEEWLRYLAVNTLLDNNETCLANGDGDDYYLYRGITDRRFKVLPYDLDTIMGQGDTPGSVTASLLRAAETNAATRGSSPAMQRFLKDPEFAPIYYHHLRQLIDTTFSATQLNPLLDQTLDGLVPTSTIEAMKAFAAARNEFVLAQIPRGISISNALPILNGYAHTTASTVSLHGIANAIKTRSVRVNGAPAFWSAWEAKWSIDNVPLQPGINRIFVQAFDDRGNEFESATTDVWFDNGTLASVSGTISADATWTAAGGPYHVTSNLTVPANVTLTIEPGTTIYLSAGVNFIVSNCGRLLAEGTAIAPIRFAAVPGSSVS